MEDQQLRKIKEFLSWFKKVENIRNQNETTKKEIEETKKKIEQNEQFTKNFQDYAMNVGEILKQLSDELFIVKIHQGSHYVVTCQENIDKTKLTQGTRVALDGSTNIIMKILPEEVNSQVYQMSIETPGKVEYNEIGGLKNQMREMREVIELPIKNPELFQRVGVKSPKGVLLYGPPGTGKTLLARALAHNMDCNFLKIVSSAIIDKWLGESSRLIRDMFNYARSHEPCVIFMDEIDAIAGKRLGDGMHGDREVQRALMELLAQMDGFKDNSKVRIIMATNRPDVLDPALMRPGRIDRKIEIPLPNDVGRIEILKIHSKKMTIQGELNFEVMSKLTDGFNGADLRNVCTEAGLSAVRDDRDYCVEEDFYKAIRKQTENKKLENPFMDIDQ